MWILKRLSDGTTKYLITNSKLYTVGRRNCDIILENDASVSRNHCNIHIAKQNECPFSINTLTGVWIVDEQSKYGTYLKNNNNWVKIPPKENKKIGNGSVIKFGIMENIWSLEFKPVVACVSGIPTEQKKSIETVLQSIDGFLRNSWCKECSLVIVNEITLTVKVVLALINGIPIVTPNYIQKVVESVKKHVAFPDYADYTPVIKESILDKSLVSLDTKHHRKELFKGMKFMIPTKKQMETLKEVILSAGGSVELLSFSKNPDKFLENNVVVLQIPLNNPAVPDDVHKSFKEISTYLKNCGRRVVPESEIAQAVAYSSTEKFCNPLSTCFNLRIGERKQVDLGPVIVEETPVTANDSRFSELGVIPSSGTIYSEALSNGTIEPEPLKGKIVADSQLCKVSGLSCSERKRTHSPTPNDQEFQKKKARSTSNTDSEIQPPKDVNSLMTSETNNKEKPITNNKPNQGKTSYITNYFHKQSKPEKTPQLARQISSSFWDCDTASSKSSKRKISIESEDSGENSSSNRKKSKLPDAKETNQTTPEHCVDTPREVVEISHRKSIDSISFPPVRKVTVNDDEDRTGYFGKDRMDTGDDDLQVNELNNTIFSLTIISPAFIKHDGSLIDPPDVPVNVKRFKKQKILTSATLNSLQEENELSDGEWIEPHAERLNLSVVEGKDW